MATNNGLKAFLGAVGVTALAYRVMSLEPDNTVQHHDGDSASVAIGFTEVKQLDSYVGVRLRNCSGTVELTAAGAVALGEEVVAAADGKIVALPAAAGDYLILGTALDTATADGDIIEILPYSDPQIVTV